MNFKTKNKDKNKFSFSFKIRFKFATLVAFQAIFDNNSSFDK